MEYRTLGPTSTRCSVLGVGCSSYWAKPSFPEAKAHWVIHEALDRGINVFDTGASYAGGEAERRLGRAIRGHRTSDLVVSTKAGTWTDGRPRKDFAPPAIRTSVEESLRRLGVERIPILYLHGPRPEHLTDDLFEEFARLRDEGKVGLFGINSFDEDVLRIGAETAIDGAMLQYNVLHQSSASIIDLYSRRDKFIVNGTAIGQALYMPQTWRPTSPRGLWYLLRALKNHRKELWAARRLRFLNRVNGVTAAQIALRFALRQPHVSSAIFGTTRVSHLHANVEALLLNIPDDIFKRIEAAT